MQGDRTCKRSAEAEKKVLLKNRKKRSYIDKRVHSAGKSERKRKGEEARRGKKRQEEAKRETKDPKDRQVRFRRRKPATAGDPQPILDWGTFGNGLDSEWGWMDRCSAAPGGYGEPVPLIRRRGVSLL